MHAGLSQSPRTGLITLLDRVHGSHSNGSKGSLHRHSAPKSSSNFEMYRMERYHKSCLCSNWWISPVLQLGILWDPKWLELQIDFCWSLQVPSTATIMLLLRWGRCLLWRRDTCPHPASPTVRESARLPSPDKRSGRSSTCGATWIQNQQPGIE